MNNKQFEEKVREVAEEEFGDEPVIKTYIITGELVRFAKRFYELGEMG